MSHIQPAKVILESSQYIMVLHTNFKVGFMTEKLSISAEHLKQDQKQRQQQKNSGQIVCCGNHVFRVINGTRYWLSPPPDDYEA